MTTPFGSAALHGYKAMRGIFGVNITYSRPSTGHSVSISKAVPGKSIHDISQDGMVIEQVKSRDFLLLQSELVLNGVEVQPMKGDRITEGSKTYAILSNGMEAEWKWADPSELILRVHTKEI